MARGGGGGPPQQREDRGEVAGAVAAIVGVSALATLAVTVFGEQIEDLVYAATEGDLLGGSGSFGAGDAAAGLLWGAALWFATPLQLLLPFIGGEFETARPSDGVLRALGLAAGQRVDAVDYSAPLAVRAAAWAIFLAAGQAVAALSAAALGDATWGVASGLGMVAAAALYEVGRPPRLTAAEAQTLEAQYGDFVVFAEQRLARGGRCHEAEVMAAFRRTAARYRSKEALSDTHLRDMIRNWHPGCDRSPNGFFRNLSLLPPTSDPFLGSGTAAAAKPAAAAAAAAAATAKAATPAADASAAATAAVTARGDGGGAQQPQQPQQ